MRGAARALFWGGALDIIAPCSLLQVKFCRVAQDRIEELQSSVSANVNDLQSKISDAEATRNSTRDSLLDFLERLKGDLAGQAQNEQQAETNTSVAIAQFQTELEALNSFKADSEKSAAELVKKLTVRIGPCFLVFLLACVT